MDETQRYWDELYDSRGEQMWSGRPNAWLVEAASDLTPGTALDLGCGEGGDAIWLAQRGWTVHAVDVSSRAIERATRAADQAGVAAKITFERVDLADGFPAGPYDLVTASFFQSTLELPRAEILQKAVAACSGTFLLVEHGAAPPWSEHHHMTFPTVEETYASLALDGGWEPVLVESRERDATGPDGAHGVLLDNVIAVRRA